MKKRIQISSMLIALAAMLLASCAPAGQQEAKGDYVIGVVTKSRNSEYWMSVCAGMEEAADVLGAKVVILSPDTETDKDIQKKMIRDLIKMDVDALAVSPIDSYDNRDYVQTASEKGIPVFSYDTPIEDMAVPYIGIDNKMVGYELAKVLAEKMGHQGNVAVIAGSQEQASHKQRVLGFTDYMETEPDIRIEVVRSGYSNLRVSEQEMEEILAEYPDLDGIMTTSAVTALGITEATKGTGIVIATVDAQEDALRAVEDGRIAVLGAQSGSDIGYEAVSYIMREKDGKEQDMQDILDVKILTRKNVKEY